MRDVIGDDDRADEVEDESVQDYADRKGLVIKNTATQVYPKRRTKNMATNGNGGNASMTKADLQDMCDQVQDILTDACTPETSREDLAAAVGDALDVLEGNGPEGDTDADEDDDADDVD